MTTALKAILFCACKMAGKLTAAAAVAAAIEEFLRNCRRETGDGLALAFVCIGVFSFWFLIWRARLGITISIFPRRTQSFSTPLIQYLVISSADGTVSGRTRRKPTIGASERCQTLLGSVGNVSFQAGDELVRAALRSMGASSSQEPPRTE